MRNVGDPELSVRVGVLRRNSGGTYAAAARESGIGAATLSAWARKLRQPRATSFERLCAVS